MRALPMIGLLALAACANGGDLGKDASASGAPGTDVAAAALRGGSPQVALRIDNEILAKDPRNLAALLSRGEAETVLQQSEAAAGSYDQALQIDPSSVQARIGLGRLRLADDPGKAEALFLDAVHRDARSAVAWNDLGIARDLLGHHQDAQVAYRQAINLDASMRGAQVNLALSMAMAGRADDAAPLLRPLADAPNASRKLRHDLAAVLAMGGDRSAAQQILAQDLPPEQVDKALSIFAAAGAQAAPSGVTDPPTSLSEAHSDTPTVAMAVPVVPVSAGPASVDLASAGPTNANPAGTAPVTAGSVNAVQNSVAPAGTAAAGADQAKVVLASADQASASPASVTLASTAPAAGAGPTGTDRADASPVSMTSAGTAPADARSVKLDVASVASASAGPTSAGPAGADSAKADQASAGSASVNSASASSASATRVGTKSANTGPLAQLATVASSDAAASEWRRMQKHFPDLLEGRKPILTESESDAGRVHWNVRTAGFAGAGQAKEFCQAAKTHGLSCFVIGS
jgi:hypothetical protein